MDDDRKRPGGLEEAQALFLGDTSLAVERPGDLPATVSRTTFLEEIQRPQPTDRLDGPASSQRDNPRAFATPARGSWRRTEKDGIVSISNGRYCADVFVQNPTVPVVVAFEPLGAISAADGRFGWGFNFIRTNGLNVISIKEGDRDAWYRRPDVPELVSMVSDEIDRYPFPRVVGYGNSLGAYAAATFAPLYRPDALLLYGPISTLNEAVVPWERRFRRGALLADWASPYNDATMGLAHVPTIRVGYDPLFTPDRLHAERLAAAAPQAKLFRTPGSQHDVNLDVVRSEMHRRMLLDAAGLDVVTHAEFAAALRTRRDRTAYFAHMLEYACAQGSEWRRSVVLAYLMRWIHKAPTRIEALERAVDGLMTAEPGLASAVLEANRNIGGPALPRQRKRIAELLTYRETPHYRSMVEHSRAIRVRRRGFDDASVANAPSADALVAATDCQPGNRPPLRHEDPPSL